MIYVGALGAAFSALASTVVVGRVRGLLFFAKAPQHISGVIPRPRVRGPRLRRLLWGGELSRRVKALGEGCKL